MLFLYIYFNKNFFFPNLRILVAPHPWLPYLATCGIDSDGKVWEPGEEVTYDPRKAETLATDNRANARHDEGEVERCCI